MYLAKIEDLKKKNSSKIRNCFYNGKVWTKNEIALETGISKAAITNILKELLEENYIAYLGEAGSTGGRKAKQYQINKDYFHIGKIMLIRRKDHYCFISICSDLLDQTISEDKVISHKGSLEELKTIVKKLYEEDPLLTVLCLSIPGICDEGYVSICDFKELEGVHLKEQLPIKENLEMIIENDVNVASIALSHSLHYRNLAFLYQPAAEYVGCGIIIDGQLYNGFSHFAGELRYLPFYDHEFQDQMLKKDPLELLRLQIETVCCVMNPETVCLCSDATSLDTLKLHLPEKHQPRLFIVDEMYPYLCDGLYRIVINNKSKGEEIS